MLQEMEVKRDVLCDSRYAYIFSVEDVNERVMAGIPFRGLTGKLVCKFKRGITVMGYGRFIIHTREAWVTFVCRRLKINSSKEYLAGILLRFVGGRKPVGEQVIYILGTGCRDFFHTCSTSFHILILSMLLCK